MRPAILFAFALTALAAELTLVQPKDLASQLPMRAPVIIHVGPNVLYRSHHIPGSIFAGPGFSGQGIEMLKTAVAKLPRDREILLYCGCCPWDHCPNIKPAAEALRGMGFTKVKALYLATGFKADWIDKGLPVEPK
ncbi:MAG: rhodanese-like domain-containing protein [Acidobacteria bacterium]|nr:rhodanese-like domain-containing protein [Acidobacteriota bacterium]